MALRVSKTGGGADFPLTFNQIKKVEGKYERKNGDVLIIGEGGTTFVADKNCRTGYSRTCCMLYDVSTGKLRRLECDKSKDGAAQWRNFTGELKI